MKQKGRLGGAAWFYAQGQRSHYNATYLGIGSHLSANVPVWAKNAWYLGTTDAKRAESVRQEFGYGRTSTQR